MNFFSCNCQVFTGVVGAMPYTIKLVAAADDREKVEACISETFDRAIRVFSTYEPDSEISFINEKLKAGEPHQLSPEMLKVRGSMHEGVVIGGSPRRNCVFLGILALVVLLFFIRAENVSSRNVRTEGNRKALRKTPENFLVLESRMVEALLL